MEKGNESRSRNMQKRNIPRKKSIEIPIQRTRRPLSDYHANISFLWKIMLMVFIHKTL